MIKRLSAMFLAAVSGFGLFAAPRLTAEAGTYAYRTDCISSGAVPGGDTVVKLEREDITLHIGSLPAPEQAVPYDAYLECNYTLYNPTAEEARVELFMPCSRAPAYVGEQAEPCALSLDGAAVEKKVRYSYVGYYNRTLDVDSCISQLKGEFPDEFYQKEGLSVSEYRFCVDLTDEALAGIDRKYLAFVLTFECDPNETRVMSCNRMYSEVVNGRVQASFDIEAGRNEICLTVVGEDVQGLTHGVFLDRSREQEIGIGSVDYVEKTVPFREYAMRGYPQGGNISEEDWYNGFIGMLSKGTDPTFIVNAIPEFIREEAFMQWYEYELCIPANSRAVHTVRENIYPTVDDTRYEYSFLLSPQLKWKSGAVGITIETPYYLAYSSLDFVRGEGEYTFSRDRLPLGELSFTLTETEQDAALPSEKYESMSPSMRLALILLGTLGGAVVVGSLITAVVIYRKKRR